MRCLLLSGFILSACTSPAMPVVTPQMGCAALKCLSCFAVPICGSVGVPENVVANHEVPRRVEAGGMVTLRLTLESRDEPWNPADRFDRVSCRFSFDDGTEGVREMVLRDVDIVESRGVWEVLLEVPREARALSYRFEWVLEEETHESEENYHLEVSRAL